MKLIGKMALLMCVTLCFKLAHCASSAPFSTQVSTLSNGAQVSNSLLIKYSPLAADDVVVAVDDTPIFSSTNFGSFVWQPRSLGNHKLSHISGTNTLNLTVNVVACDFAPATSPNPPMAVVSSISITPTTRSIPVGGGSGATITSGSGNWTAAVSDSWISLNSSSGSVGSPVAYLVDANPNVESRIGYVYVAGYVHTITQAGQGATISAANAECECDGVMKTVTVATGNQVKWIAQPNVDWLSVSSTHGVGNGTVTISVAPYNDVNTRQGTCTIAGNTYTVFQYGRRMKLDRINDTCDWHTHVIPIAVNALANTTWNITPNNSWISIVDAGNGRGGDSVSIAVSENPSCISRTGTVTIGTETFTIVQDGRTDLTFSISPTYTTASVNGANGLIQIMATPDLPWLAQSEANWLTIYGTYRNGSGNGNVVYSASPNPTLLARTGTIVVWPDYHNGMACTHTVTQPAQVSSLSIAGYEFEAVGEACSVNVSVANIVEWNITDVPSWISVGGKTSRVGPSEVTLTAAPNDAVYPRSGTVTIAGHSFVVTQKARGVELEYDNVVFDTDGQPKEGGVASFSVHPDGNVSWTAEASDPSWIVVFGTTSGTGDGEITYIIAPYVGTGESRTGWIQVGDKKVYITQRAYDLTIDPYAEWVTGNNGVGEIGVAASIGDVWSAIVTEPWITVVSGYDSGTGNGVVRFAYTENNTGKTRTGKIIVSGEAYTLTQAARIVVNISADVDGGGSVEGTGAHTSGDSFSLTAVPDEGWTFAYWTLPDGSESLQNPLPITADVAKNVTAHFTALTPDFTESAVSSTNGVLLTWRNLAWATEYRIYRAPSSEQSAVPLTSIVADGTHSYLDTTGEIGTTYWYWVEACGATITNECTNPMSGMKKRATVISPITYTNLWGATHVNPNQYEEGSSVSFKPPAGGPTGYTFAAWEPNIISSEATGAQTITAVWSANTYSIVYNPNGGSGTMDPTLMTYDQRGLVASNLFTRAGYMFQGWATSAGGAVEYAEGAEIMNLMQNNGGVFALYAVWKEGEVASVVATPTISPANGVVFSTPSCTVTLSCATPGATIYFSTNGVTPRASSSYLYTGPFTITGTVSIKAMATKAGWTKSDYLVATITKQELSLEDALDIGPMPIVITTGGGEKWSAIGGVDAKVGLAYASSGAIGDDEESWLEATVNGSGTLSFWARTSCEHDEDNAFSWDRLMVLTNGIEITDWRMDGESEWTKRTLEFVDEGIHVVRWVYHKDEVEGAGDDCAYVDGVTWTVDNSDIVVPSEVTGGGTVSIPRSWFSKYSNFKAKFGLDLSAATRKPNGKKGVFGNPMFVWQDFVAGTDPTDVSSVFYANIDMVEGVPSISWNPNLNTNGAQQRLYTIMGKKDIANALLDWHPAQVDDRFFKVIIEMPDGIRSSDAPGKIEPSYTQIAVPSAKTGLSYTGKLQTGVNGGAGYTITGHQATDAGNYTAVVTLEKGYKWDDGTLTSKSISWSIAKAKNLWNRLPSLSAIQFDVGSTVSVDNGSAKYGTVFSSYSANQLKALAAGSYTIVFSVAETSNYSSLSKSISFKVTESTPFGATYCVIDLSGGTTASSYPVTYMDNMPAGGWTDEYKTTKLVLRRIPNGVFVMGSPSDEHWRSDDETLHQVTISRPFYMAIFTVTQKQYELVMGVTPSYFKGNTRPVECVSYKVIRGSSSGAKWPSVNAVDSTCFMGRIRSRTGLDFDLPTEAQWEYACRAGTTAQFNNCTNTVVMLDFAMEEVGSYIGNSSSGTKNVGSFMPNSWGLYDMHGNVEEWCLDWYMSSLGISAVTDPKGAESGESRVVRGGAYAYSAGACRSASRYSHSPSWSHYTTGFRLCCPAGH